MSNISLAIETLKENGFLIEARELCQLNKDLYSDDIQTSLTAAKAIQELCNIRSYGNLSIKSINGWEWNTILEKACNLAKKRSNKLNERNPHR
ncbi:MAG: hypothetical protein ACR2QW_15740 [bacterium]